MTTAVTMIKRELIEATVIRLAVGALGISLFEAASGGPRCRHAAHR